MARVAKLAEKEGSRTRAILKLVGRGAIMLAALAFDASLWLLGALFAVVRLCVRAQERDRAHDLAYFCIGAKSGAG